MESGLGILPVVNCDLQSRVSQEGGNDGETGEDEPKEKRNWNQSTACKALEHRGSEE
jgi:hypothetical protein